MTKKDYIKIARVLNTIPDYAINRTNRLKLIAAFATMLKEDNTLFDVSRFTVACLKEQNDE